MSTQDPKQRRGALIAARIALVALSAFLAVEVGVRVFVGAPMAERLPIVKVEANSYRGWAMVPSETHYTYLHPVRMNALGLRGPEVEPKVPGETRILTLGDSLLYGQGVADDQTVPAHMLDLLQEASLVPPMAGTGKPGTGASWTVINGGHRAYSTHQELGMLRELGERLEPDIVVVFWFWNDVLFERPIKATNEKLKASGPIAFDVSAPVEGMVKYKWYAEQLVRRSAGVMFLYDLYRARNPNTPSQELIDDGLSRLPGYVDGFKAKAKELGSRLVFVIVPEPGGLFSPHLSHQIDRRAIEVLQERGVETLLIKPEVAAYARELGKLPTLPFDGHYTGEANRVIAEAIVRSLEL